MVRRLEHQRNSDLIALDAELRRLTRRADRQRRQMKWRAAAWQRWSGTIDEGLALVDRIDHAPALDHGALAIKFQAILWRVRIDENVIMDEGVRRALGRFGRQLAQLARH